MQFIREYQIHAKCDHNHDLFFFSSVDVESSQELFYTDVAEYPSLILDVKSILPTIKDDRLRSLAMEIYSMGRFASGKTGKSLMEDADFIKNAPRADDVIYALAGNPNRRLLFVGLRITLETIDFAFIDQIAYRNYTARLTQLDEGDELTPDYGLWLQVPIGAIFIYDLQINLGHSRVTIQPRADSVRVVNEAHAIDGTDDRYVNKDIYQMSHIRNEHGLTVIDVKEIRR